MHPLCLRIYYCSWHFTELVSLLVKSSRTLVTKDLAEEKSNVLVVIICLCNQDLTGFIVGQYVA